MLVTGTLLLMIDDHKARELLERLKNDDPQAIEVLFNGYWDPLYQYAYNIIRESNACDDIVQEIFTDLWVRRHTLTIENFGGYLFQAVKFKCLNHIRSKKITDEHLQRIDQVVFVNAIEEQIYAEELKEILHRSITKLPERCREIFMLSRYDLLSNTQIAAKLGLSVQTVKNQLSKALEKLRFDMKDVTKLLPTIILILYFVFI